MAAVVALSRAVVRIHHPSDVVGGIVVGLLLAQLVLVVGLAGPLG
jgi:membrane-associated phospholipid phosphatase